LLDSNEPASYDSKCGRRYKKKQGEVPIAYWVEDYMAIMVLM
jgi:hypothetical protein